MKIKAQVFEQDDSLRELLRHFLAGEGHEVLAYRDPIACHLYGKLGNDECCCPRTQPCADAVFIDIGMANANAFDLLKCQRLGGCKVPDENKVVFVTNLNEALAATAREFGCHHISKPYRLNEIRTWINECAARLSVAPRHVRENTR